ncbi:MAG TPA: hypothetical protein VJ385_13775, partial [Fibrobacteria bacterium]|nr:hypothetical protein [Fibrobacteria bacterium]
GSSADAPERIVHGTLRARLPGAERPTPGVSSRFKFALESHFAMARTLCSMGVRKYEPPHVVCGANYVKKRRAQKEK